MTNEEKLNLMALMTDESSSSAILSSYLTLAQQIVFEKAFPYGKFPETMPAQYDGVQVEIAVYMFNKRGAEGELVHVENGVHSHWEDGSVPPSLLRRITPYCSTLIPAAEAEEDPQEDPEGTDEIDETEP